MSHTHTYIPPPICQFFSKKTKKIGFIVSHTLYREREREMDQQVAARAPMDPKVAVEVEKYRDLGGRT
jgi:hypothetical protein